MISKADIRAEADRLRAGFEARGAAVFEADILQPAGALLDLYGEDIRARAFVTHDPLRGEMMLRPDFTVPLVQRHLAHRIAPKYTYAGEVFRRQEDDDSRPREYIQVGFEVFGGGVDADAEVFAAMADALSGVPVTATIGDFGVLTTSIEALDTTERRKRALLRHIWRPARFNALLDRYARPAPPPPPMPDDSVPHVGLRSREDIAARIAVLEEEARTPPLSPDDLDLLRALGRISETAPDAVAVLQTLGEVASSVRLAATLDALADRGVDPSALRFQASFGLTSLEYYSGFVFGFTSNGHPPLATGGRYDLLTAALNGGVPCPAVGGVIRPEALLAAKGGAT
ncbi:MAG: ATP phosphoribosyltransferase regulatory subunit [Pseudomonadota bacterium]